MYLLGNPRERENKCLTKSTSWFLTPKPLRPLAFRLILPTRLLTVRATWSRKRIIWLLMCSILRWGSIFSCMMIFLKTRWVSMCGWCVGVFPLFRSLLSAKKCGRLSASTIAQSLPTMRSLIMKVWRILHSLLGLTIFLRIPRLFGICGILLLRFLQILAIMSSFARLTILQVTKAIWSLAQKSCIAIWRKTPILKKHTRHFLTLKLKPRLWLLVWSVTRKWKLILWRKFSATPFGVNAARLSPLSRRETRASGFFCINEKVSLG